MFDALKRETLFLSNSTGFFPDSRKLIRSEVVCETYQYLITRSGNGGGSASEWVVRESEKCSATVTW